MWSFEGGQTFLSPPITSHYFDHFAHSSDESSSLKGGAYCLRGQGLDTGHGMKYGRHGKLRGCGQRLAAKASRSGIETHALRLVPQLALVQFVVREHSSPLG